jgi:hypothetical protein
MLEGTMKLNHSLGIISPHGKLQPGMETSFATLDARRLRLVKSCERLALYDGKGE